MKLKYILLIILVLAVVIIIYLYKKSQPVNSNVSFTAELDAKQKKLDLLLAQLSAVEIKKACIDRIIAWRASLITGFLMLCCLGTFVIYNFYGLGTFPEGYLVVAWYLLAMFCALYYQKIPSWSAIMEVIATRVRVLEYQKHNFEPGSIPVLVTKIVVLKEEIVELREKQKAIDSQNVCGYR